MVNTDEWGWGLKTGWFYAGLGLPFTVAMWFLIPETAGYAFPKISKDELNDMLTFPSNRRSAAELDELFERKVKPWRFHKTKTATQRIVEVNQADAEERL